MYSDLTGKNVLITGSNGLVGRALASTFSLQGANLYLHAHSWNTENSSWIDTLSHKPSYLLEADLSDSRSIISMFSTLKGQVDCIDILINNACIQDLQSIEETTDEFLDRMTSIDLHAPILCTSAMAKQVRRAKEKKQRSIIHILSIEAENPAILHSQYGAMKGGLLQFMRASALELGPLDIRVNGISPGVIYRENITEEWPDGTRRYIESSPLHTLISAEDVADAALFLASDAASKITGINLRVDAGIGVTTGY